MSPTRAEAMLRHRRHQQHGEEGEGDDSAEVHGDERRAQEPQAAIEDGREIEDRLIGQELVPVGARVPVTTLTSGVDDEERKGSLANQREENLARASSQLRTPVQVVRVSTPESVKTEPVREMPQGRPKSLAPLPPLFDDQQLQRFQEMYARAPTIYPKGPQGAEERPNFLQEDELRLQRVRQEEERLRENRRMAVMRHEEQAAIWRLYLEAIEENEMLKKRIALLTEEVATYERTFDEAQFGTPDGSRDRDLGAAEEPLGATKSRETGGYPETEKVKDEKNEKERAAPEEDQQKATIQVMLGLMQGMQDLQRRILEVKNDEKGDDKGEAEWVRGGALALPKLAEWSGTTGPIDFNDWLNLIEPQKADLTNTSAEWWSRLLQEAREWYEEHLRLAPLKRMGHEAKPSDELNQKRWSRLGRRASALLLTALPEGQRDDLVSAKRLTSLEIICHLLMTYQPGGLAEKERILKSLEQPAESGSLQDAVVNLRRWMRWRRRAADLGVSEPDPFLLLKGLNQIIRKPLELNKDLSFRISLARSTLQVDATPNGCQHHGICMCICRRSLSRVVHLENGAHVDDLNFQTGWCRP